MRIREGSTTAALVAAFTLIGRASHGRASHGRASHGRASHTSETPFVTTLWPFAAGLLVGWLVSRAWRTPLSLKTALTIWPVTVAVGVLLRALTGQGVELSFIIVTAAVLGVFLLGWRALAKVVTR